MPHYAIGDLQGCYSELEALLNQINFNHGTDTLWLVGDIVNRGPQSLQTLQFAMQHESSVQIVLGNHDLHLLALMYGNGKLKKQDTLSDIIHHSKANKIRDWLRKQPLMCHTDTHILVHAGLLPQWSVCKAQELANEISVELSSNYVGTYLARMYGNSPDQWSDELQGIERLRFTTNVFTRMRVLYADERLEFNYKSTYEQIPAHLHAWFDSPNRQNLSHTIVFGHWSALGFCNKNNVLALDTGALWGGELTAVNLSTGERFRQPSFQPNKRGITG